MLRRAFFAAVGALPFVSIKKPDPLAKFTQQQIDEFDLNDGPVPDFPLFAMNGNHHGKTTIHQIRVSGCHSWMRDGKGVWEKLL